MTVLRFDRAPGGFTGFSCSGHSGYAEAGEDIVCAAVSASVTMAECLINDIHHGGAAVTVEEDHARIVLRLPENCPEVCRQVLEGFYLCMKKLSEENPNYFKVLEV